MTTYGMRIRDSSGNVTFDTNEKCWRVTRSLNLSSGTDTNSNWTTGHIISTPISIYSSYVAPAPKTVLTGTTVEVFPPKCTPFCVGSYGYFGLYCFAESDPNADATEHGLKVINTSGDYVIDGVSETMHLVGSGTASLSGASGTDVTINYSAPINAEPLIFVQVAEPITFSSHAFAVIGGPFTGFRVRKLSGAGSTLYYRVYVRSAVLTDGGYGVKAYRADDSRVIFNSAYRLLKAKYVTTGTQTYTSNHTITHSITGGYVLINNLKLVYATGTYQATFRSVKNTGGVVSLAWVSVNDSNAGWYFSTYPDYPYTTAPNYTVVVDGL